MDSMPPVELNVPQATKTLILWVNWSQLFAQAAKIREL